MTTTPNGNGDRSFRTRPAVSGLRAPTGFNPGSISRGDDFAQYDLELERRMRRSDPGPVLVKQVAAGLRDETSLILDEDNEEEEMLKDIWANVDEGRYELALRQLEDLLLYYPENLEALYLSAYCHYRSGGDGPMRALRILHPLRDSPLEPGLAQWVRELREALRGLLTPVETAAFKATATTDPESARVRLWEFKDLVPEEGVLSVLLARSLAAGRDPRAAYAIALSGAAAAETDRDLCANLAVRLALHLRVAVADEAVACLKAGQYRAARARLAEVDAEWRRTQVIEDFDAFLARIADRPPGTVLPAPPLEGVRAQALYALIADADVNSALNLLTAGGARPGDAGAAAADRRLTALLSVVPRYPWLNFIYAVCQYVRGTNLSRAADAAAIAATDPELVQAGQLRELILQRIDAEIVNPLVDEFVAAMRSARETPAGGDTLAKVKTRLVRLQPKITRSQSATVTADGRRVLRELADLLEHRLTEMIVAILVGRFNRCTKQLSRYGPTAQDLTELRAIKRETQQASRRKMDPEDRKLIADLLRAFEQNGL